MGEPFDGNYIYSYFRLSCSRQASHKSDLAQTIISTLLLSSDLQLQFRMADANLVKFLNPNFCSSPPTNVKFVFNEDGVQKEVSAHTQILACSSEVFNREFFGSLVAEKEVEIKDASQKVFHTMIEYIYNKKPKFKDVDLKFLISLYYIAEKYDIQALCSDIVASIPARLVPKKDVLAVAILAEENIVHPPLSEALYDAAANFMAEGAWRNKLECMLNLFTEESEEHGMVVFKLIKRAKKRKLEDVCVTCEQTPCLDGKRLRVENFTPGAKVAPMMKKYYGGGIPTGCLRLNKCQPGIGEGQFFSAIEEELYNLEELSFTHNYVYKCK